MLFSLLLLILVALVRGYPTGAPQCVTYDALPPAMCGTKSNTAETPTITINGTTMSTFTPTSGSMYAISVTMQTSGIGFLVFVNGINPVGDTTGTPAGTWASPTGTNASLVNDPVAGNCGITHNAQGTAYLTAGGTWTADNGNFTQYYFTILFLHSRTDAPACIFGTANVAFAGSSVTPAPAAGPTAANTPAMPTNSPTPAPTTNNTPTGPTPTPAPTKKASAVSVAPYFGLVAILALVLML